MTKSSRRQESFTSSLSASNDDMVIPTVVGITSSSRRQESFADMVIDEGGSAGSNISSLFPIGENLAV